MRLRRIISGGQTGVDQATLRVARRFGLETGGWMPRYFMTENGPQPRLARVYGMAAVQGGYPERTRRNAETADATLIILDADPPTGGTALTVNLVHEIGKPLFLVRLASPEQLSHAATWIRTMDPQTLNVAGPRESEADHIGAKTEAFLSALLDHLGFRTLP